MSQKRHPKGRKYTEAIGDKLHEIISFLNTLDREEIDSLMIDLEGCNETNCGWLIYQQKKAITEMVIHAMSEADRMRKIHRCRMGMEARGS